MNSRTRRNEPTVKGFTIVELLIVIVVIAILAVISVIAFQGVTARAENTKTVNSVSAHAKAIMAYAQEHGTYPGAAGAWHCLPDSDNTCLSSSNVPSSCFGLNLTTWRVELNNDLNTIVKNLPKVSDQQTDCDTGRTFQGGVVFINASKTAGNIHFGLRGNVACPDISSATNPTKAFSSDTTRCSVTLPTI